MRKSNLAIIIPYFKKDFFEHTLASFSEQTCKDFTLYIGDDYSPYAVADLLSNYQDKLNIVYHRFDENIGSISLTKQWERCVNLSNEEWIWLFSDDDIVDPNAVEVFYKAMDQGDLLYKFHTVIVDEHGDQHSVSKKYDRINKVENCLSSDSFIHHRLQSHGFRSYAVEYIFHRSLFSKHGFIDFPLAWNSDDATWLQFSIANGRKIKLLNAQVYWRLSNTNISSDTISLPVVKKKMDASLLYIKWLAKLVVLEKLNIDPKLILKWFAIQIGFFTPAISFSDFRKVVHKLPYSYGFSSISFYFLRYVRLRVILAIYRSILRRIK
ncbi:glycosyltransferase family 2 protein [Sphingobacterium sp.]|uniref:glycosyltransferase family 2 protein n=1 Tax=Sphingobacterium sp. TaxID=341027 RepID=UPI0031CFE07C